MVQGTAGGNTGNHELYTRALTKKTCCGLRELLDFYHIHKFRSNELSKSSGAQLPLICQCVYADKGTKTRTASVGEFSPPESIGTPGCDLLPFSLTYVPLFEFLIIESMYCTSLAT